MLRCPISLSSTDKNVKIVRSDVMTEVRTPVPSLCVCEFMMVLPSLLPTKKMVRCTWFLPNRRVIAR